MNALTPSDRRALLAGLGRSGRPPGQPRGERTRERLREKGHYTSLMIWHEQIADWLLANPGGKLGDCAAFFGKAPTTISNIVNSDAFRAYYAKRRAEFHERLDESIVDKTAKVTSEALDLLLENLQSKRTAVPIKTLSELADRGLERLGYGVAQPQSAVNVNASGESNVVVQVSRDTLEGARERLRSQQADLAREHEERTTLELEVEPPRNDR